MCGAKAVSDFIRNMVRPLQKRKPRLIVGNDKAITMKGNVASVVGTIQAFADNTTSD